MAKLELYNGNLVEGWKLADRAYQLQPENPEDIASMARTWVLLGDLDAAEQLLLEGMEASPNNMNLREAYWMLLVVSKRFEKAERVVRELMAAAGEDAPEYMRRHLAAAVNGEDAPAWSGDEIMVRTLGSLAYQHTGDDEQARALLVSAERIIRRARLNGVDDPSIYYAEGVVANLKGDEDTAIQKLQQAYERGFREAWVLDIDGRLDALRDRPEFALFRERVREDVGQALAEVRSLAMLSF